MRVQNLPICAVRTITSSNVVCDQQSQHFGALAFRYLVPISPDKDLVGGCFYSHSYFSDVRKGERCMFTYCCQPSVRAFGRDTPHAGCVLPVIERAMNDFEHVIIYTHRPAFAE